MAAVAIVPAAGKAERFGGRGAGIGAKLLADVGGEPMLDRVIRCLVEGGVASVVVVLPPAARPPFAPLRRLDDPLVTIVTNSDPSRGMLSSIQAGMQAANGEPVLILPGDMPFVRAETVAAVIAEFERVRHIVQPRCDGKHGHPIALPARLRRDILDADPTSTLNAVLNGAAVDRSDLEVSDRGILRDIDTVDDLQRDC